jgi:putative nucleotidyltransferase with HDIG domain
VAKLIMQDPALTAKLIKIANSSFFHLREKAASIQKACSILGLNLIKELVLSTNILSSFTGTKQNTERYKFWQHSVGVAIASRIISKDYGVSPKQSDEIFTIGLLHDIGKLVNEQYFPMEYNEVLNLVTGGMNYLDAEKKNFGLTHAETGRWVAQFWNFDSKTIHSIAYHHAIEAGFQFITEREKLFLSIVHLSDVLIKGLNFGNTDNESKHDADPLVLEFLDLNKFQVEKYVITLKEKLQDIDSFLASHM